MSTFHVSPDGSDALEGSENAPFRTISRAARIAMPGDTVLVHQGIYREWVRPPRGGRGPARRITYAAAPGERAVIKGSEHIGSWEPYPDGTWCATLPNSLFGDFNPFAIELDGDWIVYPSGANKKHLGQVFLGGMRLFEVRTRNEVAYPPRITEVTDQWTGLTHAVEPAARQHVWYAHVGDAHTQIWANFGGADPRDELVEVTVRPAVFVPEHSGCDYITVCGFEMAHAATQWAPPTAAQIGLIGPNWAKNWIIEENVIHDSRCCGISLGKDAASGQNFSTTRRDLPGYQYQLESVFQGLRRGWDKDLVGSHIVRRNRIFDCGQAGIVGHMGAAFSVIENNDISGIGRDAEFFGHEIAGIKLHAAIDVQLRHNRIRHCFLGMWMDWETQGTRITRNMFYENWRDLFVEVSHGPYVVDNNIFASPVSLEILAQGGAYIHNLIAGAVRIDFVPLRSTPYHFPHSTAVAGCAVVYGGDDRLTGNVFLSGDIKHAYASERATNPKLGYGTAMYADHPASWEAFEALLTEVAQREPGDIEMFLQVEQPVYIQGNTYAAGATPFPGETDATVLDFPITMRITEISARTDADTERSARTDADPAQAREQRAKRECLETWIQFPNGRSPCGATDGGRAASGGDQDPGENAEAGRNAEAAIPGMILSPENDSPRITLPPVRIAGQEFEDPEGHPYCFELDLPGVYREAGKPSVHGPLAVWPEATESVCVWKF